MAEEMVADIALTELHVGDCKRNVFHKKEMEMTKSWRAQK